MNTNIKYIVKDVLFDVINSTQIHAMKEYENLYQGQITAIRALHQTGGKGQYDRVWESISKRNILTTLIYPGFTNFQHLPYVPIILSHSIVELLKSTYNLQSQFKWVNDIYVQKKKCCGILTQSQITGNQIVLFLGIGINVDWSIDEATNLEKELNSKIDEEILFTKLKEIVINNLLTLNTHGFKVFQDRVNEQIYRKGELCVFVDAKTEKEICEGVIEEINKDGYLVIRQKNGLSRLVEPNLRMKK